MMNFIYVGISVVATIIVVAECAKCINDKEKSRKAMMCTIAGAIFTMATAATVLTIIVTMVGVWTGVFRG